MGAQETPGKPRFAGSRARRVDPPVFALVDPWWTRAEGRPRPAAAPRWPGRGPTPGGAGRCKKKTPRPPSTSVHSERLTAPPLSAPVFGLFAGFRRMRDGMAMQEPVEQERGGGRRRPVDGSDRSGLGLGRRTARRGALRARTPAQNRRAAAHATRSGARGAQKLQTAPSGHKPGTQAARRSQGLAPPSRSDRAARTSAAVDRRGPAVEARDQPPGKSVVITCKDGSRDTVGELPHSGTRARRSSSAAGRTSSKCRSGLGTPTRALPCGPTSTCSMKDSAMRTSWMSLSARSMSRARASRA
jgi:hypothetical protein